MTGQTECILGTAFADTFVGFVVKITLYVQSVKTVGGVVHPEFVWARKYRHGTRMTTQIKYEYVLSDEQRTITETTENLCSKYGFELKTVDVTREKTLDRVMHDNIKGIDIYPALLSDSGRWIEGITSKEQVEAFLSQEKEKWL